MASFTSQLLPGERVFSDDVKHPKALFPGTKEHGRGLDLALRGPFGYAGVGAPVEPFPSELLIPKSEWQARIKEQEETKTRLSDLIIQGQLPCKNQQNTNYCWINAPTHIVEVVRLVQNQQLVILSPASVGAPLTGYQNVGGWGGPAMVGIFKLGLCPTSVWPANAIDKKYNTPQNRELALNYRQTEWMELAPRNLDQLISCLLRRIPVAGGYNFWRHEVSVIDAIWLDGTVATRIRNSWGMDWPTQGAGGWSVLQGSKMYPDDQVAPRVAIAS